MASAVAEQESRASGLHRNPNLSPDHTPLILGKGPAAETGWQRNLTLNRRAGGVNSDESLTGERGAHWWTGINPYQDRSCPGLIDGAYMTAIAAPDLTTVTRQQAIEYFQNSWVLTELLFSALQGLEPFFRPPYHALRHPMIFYYVHPAALYVNKFRVAGLMGDAIDPYMESLFETGVDSMSWDDLSKNEAEWPLIERCIDYRRKVYNAVMQVLQSHPQLDGRTPVTPESPLWAVFLGVAHEGIHLETSSVLMREMPLPLLRRPRLWTPYHESFRIVDAPRDIKPSVGEWRPREGTHYARNDFIKISASTPIALGRGDSTPRIFGWDNEFGAADVTVPPFAASTTLVTNGEFYEFVSSGAYQEQRWWSTDGWAWRCYRNVKWPTFWVARGPQGLHDYALRLVFDIIDMPWQAPVCVNYHEAEAYARWRAAACKLPIRLLTEPEQRVLRDTELRAAATATTAGTPVASYGDAKHPATTALLSREQCAKVDPAVHCNGVEFRARQRAAANLNLAYGAETPTRALPPTVDGFYDVAGNVWQWLVDWFLPLPGFAVHRYYDDFSTPCFDRAHRAILGGSFISTNSEASHFARFHFRPFFFQHAGFRLAYSIAPDAAVNIVTDAGGTYTHLPTTENLIRQHETLRNADVANGGHHHHHHHHQSHASAAPSSSSSASSSSSSSPSTAAASAASSLASPQKPHVTPGAAVAVSARTFDYESPADLARYLVLHYPHLSGHDDAAKLLANGMLGEQMRTGFMQRVAQLVLAQCKEHSLDTSKNLSALDLGCAVGALCVELAAADNTPFQRVLGIDLSRRFVDAAEQLVRGLTLHYELPAEGNIVVNGSMALPVGVRAAAAKRCEFRVGDACELPQDIGSFDVVTMCNLLCRLASPRQCLQRTLGSHGLVRSGGLLVLATPCSWSETFTPQSEWLGGYMRGHEADGTRTAVRTLDGIRETLGNEFSLVLHGEVPLLVRLHQRKFELIVSELSVWKKASA